MESHAPVLKPTLKDVRQYLYATVARCNGLKRSEVTDITPLGPAAFEVVEVLVAKLNRVISGSTEMTIGHLLKQLNLK